VSEFKIYYTTTCWGMSTSTSAGTCGFCIAAATTDYWGGSGSINVSSCTMGRCLRGSPGCVRLVKGWDIM